MIKKTGFLLLLLGLQASVSGQPYAVEPAEPGIPAIPQREQNALTGSEFAKRTAGMPGSERQQAALKELLQGNIPNFLRHLKPVQISETLPDGKKVTATAWVMPDYLAIGTNEDFLRIPLTYSTAIEVARVFHLSLPTPKLVDNIYQQAVRHFKPQPMKPGPKMRSSEYYLEHEKKIEAQQPDLPLGELVAGHKKDVVITNRLNKKPGRIAIYGWHRLNGRPIQPLSTVHDAEYADYSHGIRLVGQTVTINGKAFSFFDALKNPLLAPLFTYEGKLNAPPELMPPVQ
ncbi:MAG: hypothetical protein O2954_05800 [bacterium]|nr:hypothetical protein [bacterium]